MTASRAVGERDLGRIARRCGVPLLRRLGDIAAMVDDEALYVRHSAGPTVDRDSQSMDYESGLRLPGLSCHPLTPPGWWTRPVEDWLARQVCSYEHLDADGRFAWVLRGRVCGAGPDNEPLLDDWETVGVLSMELLDAARRRYAQRFEQHRDSSDQDAMRSRTTGGGRDGSGHPPGWPSSEVSGRSEGDPRHRSLQLSSGRTDRSGGLRLGEDPT